MMRKGWKIHNYTEIFILDVKIEIHYNPLSSGTATSYHLTSTAYIPTVTVLLQLELDGRTAEKYHNLALQ